MSEKWVAFQQNQRDEVRILGEVAGALPAEAGMKQQNYIARIPMGTMSEKWGVLEDQGGSVMRVTDKPGTLRAQSHQHEPIIFRGAETMEQDTTLSLFPSSVEDSHARITQLQESAAAWLATVVRCGGSSIGSLLNSAPSGLSERMFLGSSVPTVDGTSSQSLPALFNSGMASPGLFLTLNTSEWRSGGVACSLSAILEANPDPQYFLSPKACSGILRRAEKRGKDLPTALRLALTRRADSLET